jgi:probable HAF family extracellular repeat protein
LFDDDTSGAATAINNRGQIVGISGLCDQAVGRRTARHALLWDQGTITSLGNLGAELWITPMAINEHGDIVGFGATEDSDLNGDFLRAFIWTRKDGMKRIDPLPISDHVFSQANGINERGQVVGSSCTITGACLGFFWQDGIIRYLKDLVPGFTGAIINGQDINDAGEITGRAVNPATGKITAFRMVPISGSESAKALRSSGRKLR